MPDGKWAESAIYYARGENSLPFLIYGAIYQKWKSMDYERSKLGFPSSREKQEGDHRVQGFDGGSIYYSPTKGITVKESKIL